MIREDRYIVIKKRDLQTLIEQYVVDEVTTSELNRLLKELPPRQYVVVESDWPEYEKVWQMIEDRVENTTA